jgi:hypothetical protein
MRACGSLSAAVRASGFLSTTPNHYGRLICAHAVLVERAALFGRFRSAPANDSIDMQYTPESEPGRSRQGRAQREVYTLKPSEVLLISYVCSHTCVFSLHLGISCLTISEHSAFLRSIALRHCIADLSVRTLHASGPTESSRRSWYQSFRGRFSSAI